MAWLNQLSQVQFEKNFLFYLISTCLLELLAAEYLRETNINFYISFIDFCSLDAVKKASKKKETRINMEIVEVLQQTSLERDRDDDTLGFDLVFVG